MSKTDNSNSEVNNHTLLSHAKPNVTDFLTFLCYRRTHLLPSNMNFVKVLETTGESTMTTTTPSVQQHNYNNSIQHKPTLIGSLIKNDFDVRVVLRRIFLGEDYLKKCKEEEDNKNNNNNNNDDDGGGCNVVGTNIIKGLKRKRNVLREIEKNVQTKSEKRSPKIQRNKPNTNSNKKSSNPIIKKNGIQKSKKHEIQTNLRRITRSITNQLQQDQMKQSTENQSSKKSKRKFTTKSIRN